MLPLRMATIDEVVITKGPRRLDCKLIIRLCPLAALVSVKTRSMRTKSWSVITLRPLHHAAATHHGDRSKDWSQPPCDKQRKCDQSISATSECISTYGSTCRCRAGPLPHVVQILPAALTIKRFPLGLLSLLSSSLLSVRTERLPTVLEASRWQVWPMPAHPLWSCLRLARMRFNPSMTPASER